MDSLIFAEADIMVVNAPDGVANCKMNGCRCVLKSVFNHGTQSEPNEIANVVFIDGDSKGLAWQINPDHLVGFEAARLNLSKQVNCLRMRPFQSIDDAKMT